MASTIPHERLEANSNRSLKLALAAARVAAENRAEDVRVLDMRGQTPQFDYFVIATGFSRRQLHAISEDIDHKLEDDMGDKRRNIAGYDESRWIVLDYGDVVVHLFEPDMRAFYSLENLWAEAKPVDLTEILKEA
ncbi:Ribosomal silencing factor RsfS [Lignipirellula cremea]|uniref:Ribosomal silencing factor RsfS n=1 Tax=Lignipirellula cremea TaxID=2528010 RepID=A0A518DZG1_9BACT|nr:Ribosomal silencing factor RsfS [Lignipirellula cremea]